MSVWLKLMVACTDPLGTSDDGELKTNWAE